MTRHRTEAHAELRPSQDPGAIPGARIGLSRRALLACSLLALALAGPAGAVVDVNKSFVPINAVPGQTSTMTISLFNSATAIAGGTQFTDTLPANVTAVSVVSNGCGGTFSIVPATQVSLTGGSIPAGDGINSGRCDVVVTVRSTIPGTYVNTIPAGGVTTTDQGSNPQAASATLTVSPFLFITGTKAFSPNVLHVDPTGVSTVTITLTNPNTQLPLTNVSFTDNLPGPLEISSPVTTGGTCGGAFTDGSSGTLDPADTSFRITGGSLAAGGSCTVTVQVRVRASEANVARNGAVTNTIGTGTVTTAEGVTTGANISGNVTVQTGAAVVKAFAPATVTVGGSSTLTLTLRNFNLTAIFPADLVDAMPAGITVVGPVSTTCGGTATFTAAQVQLTGGTIPAATSATTSNFGSCTITATVQGTTIGSLVNNIPTGTFGTVAFSTTGATLTVNPAATSVSAAKSFSPSAVVQSQTTTLTITLSNASGLNAAITSFTDNLTSMGTGFTVAASPAATTTCGGALGAVSGSTSITLSGGTIPAGGNCTITVPVAVAPNATTGTRTNTIAAGALVTDQGNNAFPATATLTVNQAAAVSKSWNPTTVLSGGISRLTINISHANGAIAFTSMGLTDLLTSMGAGFVVAATPNVSNNCGGTVTAAAGTTSIVLAGGSLGTGTTACQIRVDVQTPPAGAPGSYRNRIAANNLSTAEGFTYNANADANLTLQAAPSVTLNKAFTPVVSNGGAPSVASVTIANNRAGAIGLTNVSLVDTLPANVEVYSVPSATFTGGGCSGATISAVPFSNQIGISGATINANSTCTLSVNVTAFVDGNHVNDIPVGALASAQGVTNDNQPSATLTILRNVNVAKSFSPNVVEVGGTSTLTIRISNTNTVPRTLGNPGLVDTLPAGVTVAAAPAPATSCPAATVDAPSGGGTITVRNGNLAASSSCTVTVPVTVGATGTYVNTIAANTLVTLEGSSNPDPATDTLRAVAKPTIIKTFTPASIPAGGTSTITFTLSNPNNGTLLPGGMTGASFTDTLAGMAISANQNAAGTCGGAATNAFVTGQTALSFAGLAIPAGSPGTCTVTVVVTAPNPGIFPNASSGVLTNQTQTPGSPSPSVDLTVLAGPPTIAKAFLPVTILGGGNSVLTFTLTNPNAVAAALASPAFTDVFPTSPGAMTLASTTVSSTCGGTVVDSGGAALNIGDAGIRLNGGSIPANGSCTIAVTVTAGVPGVYANTSSLLTSTNAGTSVSPATASLTVSAQADLSLLKLVSNPTPFVGSAISFTVTLTNAGPAPADGVTVTDLLPVGYTYVGAIVSQGTYNPGTGVWNVGTVGVGATPTLAVEATVNLAGPYGTNVAEVSSSSLPDPDSTPGNGNPAEDDYASAVAAPIPAADLVITKTDGVTTVVPGGAVTYTIVASNVGPLSVTGATVADTFPATLTGVTWTCVAAGGGSCTASGSGNISDTVNLPVGATATYTVTGTVSPTATGTLVNTATVTAPGGVTDPTPGNNTATDTDTLSPSADLTITKTDGVASVIPGNSVTYTITATNVGPSAVTGATVADTFPATLTGVTWTCVAAGGGSCTASGSGNISDTVNLPVGATATYTVTGTVSPTATGTLVNTATVTAPGGVTDPTPGNNTATDTDTLSPSADLTITKTDGVASVIPGNSVTYTITATNVGPSAVTGATVADTFPATLTGVTWTCVAAGGGSCTASGSGNISDTVNLPVGATATYTVTGTVSPTATGTLVNTATVTAPGGVTDPTPGNNTATDTDTLSPSADLTITKTDGVASVIPGNSVTYTITATNVGPSAVTGATVADTFPATLTGVTWTCVAAGGGSCTASGSGNISDTVNLPVGATATYTVTGTVSPTATGTLVNTATVTAPGGVTDPTPGNNTATDTDTLSPSADLTITKTDGVASVIPGNSVTYTITATNVGPSAVTGATVADTFPATLTGVTWTCVAAGGGSCTASGSGNISDTVNLPVGATATYTVTGTVSPTATGTLVNTATVTAPGGVTDPTPGNNSATDTDTLSPSADLTITKTDGVATVIPGNSVTYTITATNVGPSAVTGATVADTFPATLTGVTWTCVAAGGGSCTASGSGNISDTVNLPVGATATYTVTGTVSPTATGTLVNTATVTAPGGVTDPTPGNNSATDTDTLSPSADLTITKTDGVATVIPGNSVTYTVVASNVGPSAVTGATVADTFPATLTGVTWTCVAAGGGSCTASGSGNISDTVNLPVGATATYTVTGTVSPTATGTLVNTATVTAPGGVTDPTPGNNTATDTDTLSPSADLTITKTDGVASVIPGNSVTYTITATNVGPSAVTGATVADTFPATLTGVTWTCVAAGGGSCTASGSGNISDTVNLPVGATATYTVTGTVSPTATGTLVNTATVTAPGGVTDPTPGNNTATDTDTLSPSADLTITKTDGVASVIPGNSVTYTITATNVGPSAVTGATVADTFPATLTGVTWTCVAAGGGSCTASGSGNISDTVNLPVGATATYTVTGTVSPTATGTLVNTATVTAPGGVTDPTPGNNTATDTDTLSPSADLTITKTDGVASVIPGNSVTYTITATNVGPSAVTGATVADTFPATLTGVTWTCVAAGGGSCTASGSGNISDTVNLPVGATATYTVTGTVSPTATGTLVNTATVTAPGGVTDPTPGNNTATDTDTLTPRADLYVVKTGPGSATAGTNVTFNLVVGNDGPSDATGVSVTDPTPAGLTFVSASAPCAGGFPCAIGSLARGASVGLTVTYGVPADYTAPDPIVNTASVAGDQPDPDPTDNTSTSSTAVGRTPSADVGVVKSGPATASAGSTVTYALVVTNHGPDDAAGVSLADPTPAGLAFLSASAPCAGGFPCALGTLNAGASLPVSVTFTVPAGYTTPDPIVNVATVSTTTTDPNPANDSGSASTALGADPVDLSVVKTGPASVNAGSDVTFGFLVRNAGPATATSVQLADPAPAGLSFVSASAPCTGGFPCALGTLAAGATVNLTATFNVPAGYAGANPVANTASVSSAEPDANPGDNTSTATVGVGAESADLAIVKTGPATAVAGNTVTWQITVRNLGPGSAQGVSLADPTPAGLSFVSASAPCTGGFPCTLGTLAAGSSVTVAATFSVPGGYTSPNPILNTAAVTSTTPDGNPANDTSTVSTPLEFLADLAVLKTDGSATYVPGGPVAWTITVTNNGPSTVTSLSLSDPLPAGLIGAVFTPSTGTYDSGTGGWTGLNLAAGQSVSLTLAGVVSPSATGPLVNTAIVAPPPGVTDPNPGNDTSTDTDVIDPRADLSVTKTDGTANYTPGGTTAYTIVVANAGPSDAVGATVADPLPAGITTASWSCAPSAGSTCTASGIGSISDTVTVRAGGTLTYTLTLTIPSDRTGDLVNTATVTPPVGVTDPNPGDDTSTDTDSPSPLADVVLTKVALVTSIAVGSDFDYRITVRNLGPSNATNVVVTDPLPSNLLFVGVTTTQGICSGTTTVTCAIGLLVPGAQAEIVLRARPMTPGTIVNTATATLDQNDPTPPNNTATAPLDAVGEAVIPTVSGAGLLALALLVAAAGILLLRRSFPVV